jgi:hypothetical protein
MNLTATSVAVIVIVIALVRMFRRHWSATRLDVILMLLGGFGIIGSGLVGQWLASAGQWVGGLLDSTTSQAFGVGIPLVAVVGMAVLIIVDLKDRQIWRFTPWVALAFPTVLQVVGGISTGVGVAVLNVIGEILTGFADWLGSLG